MDLPESMTIGIQTITIPVRYPYVIGEKRIGIMVPKKILVFAPHPDDEVISCGGTLLKYSDLGSKVTVKVIKKVDEKRIKEFEICKKLMGFSETSGFMNLPIDTLTGEVIEKITNEIRKEKPDIIFLPHPLDRHRSHRNTALAVLEAVYHSPTQVYLQGGLTPWLPLGVYCYETPSFRFEFAFGSSINSVIVVEIPEKYYHRKLYILKEAYKDQEELLHWYGWWIHELGRIRGLLGACRFGEAFIPDTHHIPLRCLIC